MHDITHERGRGAFHPSIMMFRWRKRGPAARLHDLLRTHGKAVPRPQEGDTEPIRLRFLWDPGGYLGETRCHHGYKRRTLNRLPPFYRGTTGRRAFRDLEQPPLTRTAVQLRTGPLRIGEARSERIAAADIQLRPPLCSRTCVYSEIREKRDVPL